MEFGVRLITLFILWEGQVSGDLFLVRLYWVYEVDGWMECIGVEEAG